MLLLDPEQRRHVRLLTYGSPLHRVYGRYFPAYLGERALRRIGQVMPARQLAEQPVGTGTTWSWRNLWTPSDLTSGPIFYNYNISVNDNRDVDWQIPSVPSGITHGFWLSRQVRRLTFSTMI